MALLGDKMVLRYELTFQDIIRILELVDKSPFQELEIELDGLKLRLEAGREKVASTPSPLPASPQPGPVPADQDGHQGAVAEGGALENVTALPETADGIEVTSVSGGIFYRAPGPGEPPYTEVGQSVKAGATLGLIEVMKLFTPVTATVAGTVSAIRVANEEPVKAGQVLVVIAPASV